MRSHDDSTSQREPLTVMRDRNRKISKCLRAPRWPASYKKSIAIIYCRGGLGRRRRPATSEEVSQSGKVGSGCLVPRATF